ncbi:BgTH12-00637 [Blumeria graminis f. sp. triticale]|uniref:Bgt-3932 n=3 Tax=Blumeria graminis TaxID=34373 RepID=A0A061HPB1_BLUGR|nr:hypothetical protein BGT96224_3932 [Blumeria graminis f. sp. tritici 96224]CAD6505142.1 BgTH12-00637 [Blumeria graminis f. sp. triticale]VDB93143.1 Bgt-3932 [Blumeria graminis f. sp. tritici]
MPDKDAGTPRVFLIRHGETEWSMTGRHTGRTDIPLTANGENQVLASGQLLVGSGKIIDPARLVRVFVSPRIRAQKTYDLLFENSHHSSMKGKVETSENIREWEYGAYEGLLTAQIRASRKERKLDVTQPWNIWLDGCEDGESPAEVRDRLDELNTRIRDLHQPNMLGEQPADVVIIAHGHILRAFAKRWIGYELGISLPLMLEPGAIGVLSYEHHRIDEPALLLGINMGEFK